MNRMMNEKRLWIEAAHGMTAQLFGLLSDAELAFTPGGQNMTLGALCRALGETEYAYLQSLTTSKHEWSYRHPEADVVSSVALLKGWFHTLNDDMEAVIAAFRDEDENKPIDRGGGAVTVAFQLDAYQQAVLIFLGKATIYLKAMNKPLPKEFQEYIG